MTSNPRPPAKEPANLHWLCITLAALALCGCVSKVQIPTVERFQIASGDQQGTIDAAAHSQILLGDFHRLLKSNEGVEVPLCTAERETRKCTKDGISVFVMGGGIPGMGKRTCYVFSDIALANATLEFSKDNRGTTFIGTPMMTRSNKCLASVKDGGLLVEMTRYYANWAGVGNMIMAEGWAIDFMDFDHGIVGLQLELDIKGAFVAGGGSRYVLLKFPNIPDALGEPASQFKLSDDR